jgi:hypothetical protein
VTITPTTAGHTTTGPTPTGPTSTGPRTTPPVPSARTPSAPPGAVDIEPCVATLVVVPWDDPVVDRIGHRADSVYVEMYWLGVLGPTATWLLRRLNAGLDDHPDGYEIDLPDTARSLGISYGALPSNPFTKALHRCVMFGLARPVGTSGGTVAVRRRVPALSRRHLARLPIPLQEAHAAWANAVA